jgi:hypothetical protein
MVNYNDTWSDIVSLIHYLTGADISSLDYKAVLPIIDAVAHGKTVATIAIDNGFDTDYILDVCDEYLGGHFDPMLGLINFYNIRRDNPHDFLDICAKLGYDIHTITLAVKACLLSDLLSEYIKGVDDGEEL